MYFLYIYKLKINVKLQEKTLAKWDMSIHHVPIAYLAVSISEAKVLFLMFWSAVMVYLKQQRNRVCTFLETIKLSESPLTKLKW